MDLDGELRERSAIGPATGDFRGAGDAREKVVAGSVCRRRGSPELEDERGRDGAEHHHGRATATPSVDRRRGNGKHRRRATRIEAGREHFDVRVPAKTSNDGVDVVRDAGVRRPR